MQAAQYQGLDAQQQMIVAGERFRSQLKEMELMCGRLRTLVMNRPHAAVPVQWHQQTVKQNQFQSPAPVFPFSYMMPQIGLMHSAASITAGFSPTGQASQLAFNYGQRALGVPLGLSGPTATITASSQPQVTDNAPKLLGLQQPTSYAEHATHPTPSSQPNQVSAGADSKQTDGFLRANSVQGTSHLRPTSSVPGPVSPPNDGLQQSRTRTASPRLATAVLPPEQVHTTSQAQVTKPSFAFPTNPAPSTNGPVQSPHTQGGGREVIIIDDD